MLGRPNPHDASILHTTLTNRLKANVQTNPQWMAHTHRVELLDQTYFNMHIRRFTLSTLAFTRQVIRADKKAVHSSINPIENCFA